MISLTTLTAISSFDRLAAESNPHHRDGAAKATAARPVPRRSSNASTKARANTTSTFISVAILALSAVGGVALVLVAG